MHALRNCNCNCNRNVASYLRTWLDSLKCLVSCWSWCSINWLPSVVANICIPSTTSGWQGKGGIPLWSTYICYRYQQILNKIWIYLDLECLESHMSTRPLQRRVCILRAVLKKIVQTRRMKRCARSCTCWSSVCWFQSVVTAFAIHCNYSWRLGIIRTVVVIWWWYLNLCPAFNYSSGWGVRKIVMWGLSLQPSRALILNSRWGCIQALALHMKVVL